MKWTAHNIKSEAFEKCYGLVTLQKIVLFLLKTRAESYNYGESSQINRLYDSLTYLSVSLYFIIYLVQNDQFLWSCQMSATGIKVLSLICMVGVCSPKPFQHGNW